MPASNRMGIRLKGTPLSRRPGELVSEAVAPGAVQVTNDGLPVVLGVDGQTIGGYPKVAHVIRADLDLLAQLRPGERVRFDRVDPEEAERAATEQCRFPDGMADAPPHRGPAAGVRLILCGSPEPLSCRGESGGAAMKSWIVGALVGACVGVVIYLVLSQKPAPSQESRHDPPAPPPSSSSRASRTGGAGRRGGGDRYRPPPRPAREGPERCAVRRAYHATVPRRSRPSRSAFLRPPMDRSSRRCRDRFPTLHNRGSSSTSDCATVEWISGVAITHPETPHATAIRRHSPGRRRGTRNRPGQEGHHR